MAFDGDALFLYAEAADSLVAFLASLPPAEARRFADGWRRHDEELEDWLNRVLPGKANLSGATFTGPLSGRGLVSTTPTAVRVDAGKTATNKPVVLFDDGTNTWRFELNGDVLRLFRNNVEQFTVDASGHMTLAGNLPSRGATKRGGITQDELDFASPPRIEAALHKTINQDLPDATIAVLAMGSTSGLGDITVLGNTATVNVAGHYEVVVTAYYSALTTAGGVSAAGSRQVWATRERTGTLYRKRALASVGAGEDLTLTAQRSDHFLVGDKIYGEVYMTGAGGVKLSPSVVNGESEYNLMTVRLLHA